MKTYNGWTNQATWQTKLWIGNEESSYRYWREQAQEIKDQQGEKDPWLFNTTQKLAEALKDHHREQIPEEIKGVYLDLLTTALDEVNWVEIADSLLEE